MTCSVVWIAFVPLAGGVGERGRAGSTIHSVRPAALIKLCDSRWDGRMVCAHRGDPEAAPDNSSEAIAAAARVADTIEIDVRASSDGVYFCFHDGQLGRQNCVAPETTWYGRAFKSFTADQIRRLRLPGPNGKPILTFSEALAVGRKHRACLELDLKGESNVMAEAVLRHCRSAGMERAVLVECQSPTTLAYVRKNHPDVATLARARNDMTVRLALKLKATVVQVDDDWATEEIRRRVRSAGAKLLVKTMGRDLDRPTVWVDRYEKGYHLLMTNRPRALRAWLAEGR